jgi:CrcB protein
MPDWFHTLLVFVGGGAGAVLRFATNRWAAGFEWGRAFPWATFGINLLGSFALGVLAVACANRPGWRALLGVGVCGGFTTFSAFSVETLHLLQDERYAAAVAYVVGSVLAGLAGAWAGVQLAGGR